MNTGTYGHISCPKDEKVGQLEQTFTSNHNVFKVQIWHWNSVVNILENILDRAQVLVISIIHAELFDHLCC